MQETDRLQRLEKLSPAKRALLLKALHREAAQGEAPERIPRLSRRDAIPVSFAQQSLWFLHQLEPDDPAYNVPAAVRLNGQLNVAALERSLNEIIRRHEVLRTTFATVAGESRQVIREEVRLRVVVESLEDLPAGEREREAEKLSLAEVLRAFDLVNGTVLRVKLLRTAREEHILLLTMHHIVADGWSMGILIRELATLYEAFSTGQPSPLAELPLQYADYAAWQRDWLTGSNNWRARRRRWSSLWIRRRGRGRATRARCSRSF